MQPNAQLSTPAPPAGAGPAGETTEPVVVANAGMVLAAPYMPRLFDALDLLHDGAFIDAEEAGRAVHLLQFKVTGEARTPAHHLVLNKVLCGLDTAAPVPAGIDITPAERDTVLRLIAERVAQATMLGSCSVAAMRATFFARHADLQLAGDAWRLRVHPGPFDMLLDRLPWTYSNVRFGWMNRPVEVAWRPT
jgi:hypothetical protein